jgi:hypothetical protein
MTGRDAPGKEMGAREYLRSAFEASDRLAVLVRNRRRGETLQRIASVEKILEPAFEDWLRFKNGRDGFDIYVGMNPLKPAARTRTKEDILSIRHLYVDLDHDGRASLALIEQSKQVPRPNYVVSTSPDKFQVVWKVEGIAQNQAEALLRAMARKFGGDPAATDSTRVLRIPGFANKKYEEEFVVKAEQRSDRVHGPLDFKVRLEPLDSPYQPVRRNSNATASTELRPLGQSEHDWAFAKRALARGTDPEEVIRSIAQFREGEKHNPLDYARRTVDKAQQALNVANKPLESSPERPDPDRQE